MTIIAVDQYTAACDGLAIDSGRITDLDLRKIAVSASGDRLYAFCGVHALFQPAVVWFEASAHPADLPRCAGDRPSDVWTLAIIEESGIRCVSSALPWPDHYKAPFAMGCGRDYAFGALWAGMSARRAVELVCANTDACGGEIFEFPLPWAKPTSADEAAARKAYAMRNSSPWI